MQMHHHTGSGTAKLNVLDQQRGTTEMLLIESRGTM